MVLMIAIVIMTVAYVETPAAFCNQLYIDYKHLIEMIIVGDFHCSPAFAYFVTFDINKLSCYLFNALILAAFSFLDLPLVTCDGILIKFTFLHSITFSRKSEWKRKKTATTITITITINTTTSAVEIFN
ncbi:hypothetical protein T4C_12045 [Trichinella pseudospiralis]|uniref:G-protein coupled receptors family 1 profile domain-containing protein n=1 Tax=Trichinella pseudospiralis TaxID=6337 RepID=A0A0V1J086_TRIPS|nr:hypothetical protein T4C_12045 [Trichinella pseudospiralis]